jgi:chemotaxis-related protein WspB
MVFLHFRLGSERYVLDAAQVVAVVPWLTIRAIPQLPPALLGLIDYRGVAVPVVDLSLLALQRPARRSLSTRIVLVNYPDRRGTARLLGLIAERATETLRLERSDFVDSGIDHRDAPYLGPIARDAKGMLQWVTADRLLAPEIRDVLFPTETDDVIHGDRDAAA